MTVALDLPRGNCLVIGVPLPALVGDEFIAQLPVRHGLACIFVAGLHQHGKQVVPGPARPPAFLYDAENAGIENLCLNPQQYKDRVSYDAGIIEELKKNKDINILVPPKLAGVLADQPHHPDYRFAYLSWR